MANHNPNGRNVTRPDENRPSWRPQDQQASSTQRSRGHDDDRMHRDDRDMDRFSSNPRSVMGSNWEDDRDEGYRGTERYGQGQSGYGGGRIEGDRSWSTRNQSFEGRGHADNQDDRWSGRGGQGYYERGRGEDRGRMGHRNMGGDFDADVSEYNSGYNQGAMGYGGYGMSGPQQGMGAQGFRGGSGGAQLYRDDSQGRYGGQDRGMADGRWGNQQNQYGGGSYGGSGGSMRSMYQGQTGYGPGSGYNEGGLGGDMRYGQGHQGMGHTQGQGFGQSGGQYGTNQQRGLGHRGKGPQGWQRSDEKIKDMVCEMLHDDDDIDASRIQVDVKSGEVVLTGTVPDRHMKRAAEDLIERCSGVKDVQNNLRVQAESRGNNGHASNAMTSSSVSKNETDTSDRGDKKHRA